MASATDYFHNVFINCPFDAAYRPQFQALAFAVTACGFVPRCALEAEDSGDIRIREILDIIEQCDHGIHDISRTESSALPLPGGGTEYLPRFNMPLELGLFVGAQRFGGKQQKRKNYLLLDTEQYRFQKFISDLAGQDIKAHGWPGAGGPAHECDQAIGRTILAVRNWLTTKIDGDLLKGGQHIAAQFAQFRAELPDLATSFGQAVEDLSFYDLSSLMTSWVKANN